MKTNVIIQLFSDLVTGQANLNEIVYQLKEIGPQILLRILQAILMAYQEEIIERLTSKHFSEERKGLGFHKRKDDPQKRRCGGRKVKRRGFRSRPRKIKTIFGELELQVREVECLKCGARFCPLLEALGIEDYSHKEANVEHEVIQAVIDTNYRRLIEGISVDLSLGGIHNIVVGSDIDEEFQGRIETEELQAVLPDGTKLKQYRGKKGDLKAVVGINAEGRVVPIGSWVNRPWDEIEQDIKQRLNICKKLKIPCISDGELGLDCFLSGVVERAQRCTWHAPRGLYHALWEDGLTKAESSPYQEYLKALIGIEIPQEDYEVLKEEDIQKVKEQYQQSKLELNTLIEAFEQRGYQRATEYLKGVAKDIWAHVEIWLETGIISPKTTSLLERVFRELGRRLKKIAWGWSDLGALNISKMILLKQYAKEKWEAFWKKKLGIKGAFKIEIVSVKILPFIR